METWVSETLQEYSKEQPSAEKSPHDKNEFTSLGSAEKRKRRDVRSPEAVQLVDVSGKQQNINLMVKFYSLSLKTFKVVHSVELADK